MEVYSQQPTEATTYQNIPMGTQMLQMGYLYQSTNSTVDGAITFPNNNVNINANIAYLRYANFFQLGKVGAGFQMVLPFAGINADILGKEGNNSGFGDLVIGMGTGIFGAPPLSFKEFAVAKKNIAMGWALMITAPTGSYSTNKLLNPSGHRWTFRPELGLTIPVKKWDIETYVAIKFFTKNEKLPFIPDQPIKAITQKPLFSLTFNAVYNVNPKFWVALYAAGRLGGETASNGIADENSQTAMGLGASASYKVASHHLIGASYITNSGGNDFAPNGSIFSLKYSYVFSKEMNIALRKMRLNSNH